MNIETIPIPSLTPTVHRTELRRAILNSSPQKGRRHVTPAIVVSLVLILLILVIPTTFFFTRHHSSDVANAEQIAQNGFTATQHLPPSVLSELNSQLGESAGTELSVALHAKDLHLITYENLIQQFPDIVPALQQFPNDKYNNETAPDLTQTDILAYTAPDSTVRILALNYAHIPVFFVLANAEGKAQELVITTVNRDLSDPSSPTPGFCLSTCP